MLADRRVHILFDLDGTVTDSFVAIRVTVEQTLLDLVAHRPHTLLQIL